MLSFVILCHYAECHYAECHYAECHYAECHYAECHNAECRYAECRGAFPKTNLLMPCLHVRQEQSNSAVRCDFKFKNFTGNSLS